MVIKIERDPVYACKFCRTEWPTETRSEECEDLGEPEQPIKTFPTLFTDYHKDLVYAVYSFHDIQRIEGRHVPRYNALVQVERIGIRGPGEDIVDGRLGDDGRSKGGLLIFHPRFDIPAYEVSPSELEEIEACINLDLLKKELAQKGFSLENYAKRE